MTATMSSTVDEDVSKTLKSFWELESIGILNEKSLLMKEDEIYALKHFKEGLSFDGERFRGAHSLEKRSCSIKIK